MDVAGRRISGLFRGPWKPSPAVEMSGLAGPVWQYCDVYLELDDGSILLLVPGEVRAEPTAPPAREALDTFEARVSEAIGATVVDVLETDGPSVYVVLDGGRYLESTLNPGGTAVRFDTFATWSPESLAARARSLLTHQERTFGEFVAPARAGNRGGSSASE